jgi:predicted  nucleic acid-binding Zn-ribbon protein
MMHYSNCADCGSSTADSQWVVQGLCTECGDKWYKSEMKY